MSNVLEVKNMSIFLKQDDKLIPAVNDVSFVLSKNDTLGIIGESGSGKSLTCSAIMGLLHPDKWQVNGEVFLNGEPIPYWDNNLMSEYRGNRLALIMQNPMSAFNPMITIEKHFFETINRSADKKISKKEIRNKAKDILISMRIRDPEAVLDSYSFQLSGGMLQRVMIGLALVMEPDVLIADEPTTALDLTIQHEVINLLNELQQKTGTSILVVSHDLGVIKHLATEIAVMYAGSFIEKGVADKVVSTPYHPYTKGLFLSKPNFSKNRLLVLEGQPPILTNRRDGCEFYDRCNLKSDSCANYDLTPYVMSDNHCVKCGKYM